MAEALGHLSARYKDALDGIEYDIQIGVRQRDLVHRALDPRED